MISGTEVRFKHLKERNSYNTYYQEELIGTVRHTPNSVGTWTFTSSQGKAETFGSTRLQAVGYFLEHFQRK